VRKRQLKMYFWIWKDERDFIDREVVKANDPLVPTSALAMPDHQRKIRWP